MQGEFPTPPDPSINRMDRKLVTLPALDGITPTSRPQVKSDPLVYGPAPEMTVPEEETPPIQVGHPDIRR